MELCAEICQDLLQRSCRESLLGTRLGSMGTTQRSNNSLRSGRAQHLQDQRRRDVSAAQRRASSLISSTVVGVVYCELIPGGLTVNGKFYCSVLRHLKEDIWRENNLNCGARAIGCLMTTMHPHTELNMWVSRPTCQIWRLAYSCRVSCSWRFAVLALWRRSSESQKVLNTCWDQDFQTSTDYF